MMMFITVYFCFLPVLIVEMSGVLLCFRVFGAALLSTDRDSGMKTTAKVLEEFSVQVLFFRPDL